MQFTKQEVCAFLLSMFSVGLRLQTWVEGWNSADVNKQDPLIIFAVNVANLQRSTHRYLGITPIFYSSMNIFAENTSIKPEHPRVVGGGFALKCARECMCYMVASRVVQIN